LIDYTTDDSDDVTDIDCMRYFHDRVWHSANSIEST
jgi:hypothetical protein